MHSFGSLETALSTQTFYSQKLESLGNILLLIVWIYLHYTLCGGLQKHMYNVTVVCVGRKERDFAMTIPALAMLQRW